MLQHNKCFPELKKRARERQARQLAGQIKQETGPRNIEERRCGSQHPERLHFTVKSFFPVLAVILVEKSF